MTFLTKMAPIPVLALCLSVPLSGATAQGYELGEPIDVTMNVRVKVDGNISAIDTGIDILCDIGFDGGIRQSVQTSILPVGDLFTPQTADGFIEVQIRLEDVYPPDPDFAAQSGLQEGELYYRCEALRGDTGRPFLNVANDRLVAPNPVDVGTCPIAGHYVYPQTEQPPRDTVICATLRQ